MRFSILRFLHFGRRRPKAHVHDFRPSTESRATGPLDPPAHDRSCSSAEAVDDPPPPSYSGIDPRPSTESHPDESQHLDWGLHRNDQDLAGVLLSLTSLFKAIFPQRTLLELIREANKRPPSVLAQHLCSMLFKELDDPLLLQLRASNIGAFRRYIDRMFNSRKSQLSTLSCEGLEFTGQATDILQLLSDTGVDLGWVDWHHVTAVEFAVTIGFLLGENREFVNPDISLEAILELATIVAHSRARKAQASLV